MVASELHSDGTRENKIFAPGYGEFSTAGGGDLEALALAVPTDTREDSMPAELRSLAAAAEGVLELARLEEWDRAAGSVERMNAAWARLRVGNPPPRIARRLSGSLAALGRAVHAHAARRVAQRAIDVSQSVLDLQLQYRPSAEIGPVAPARHPAAHLRAPTRAAFDS